MIDLHLHTTASDGTLTPAALVARAAGAGLGTISITDHDTVAGLEPARGSARDAGIRLIDGIEITAVEDGRDVHVLGYFIDERSTELAGFLARQRADRVRRLREMAERLASLGMPIDIEALVSDAAVDGGRSLGRPRIADALVAAGHAADRRDAFDRLLGHGRPAFVPRCGAPVAAVIEIVHHARGIASLAHPGLTGVDRHIARFAAEGLDAIEATHSDHDAEHERAYRQIARDLNLAVTGGSDFHGDVSHHAPLFGEVSLPEEDLRELERRAATR